MMQCPKCSSYLAEKNIIKTDVKYAPGNIPVEYDAQCPECRAEMGRVSWGKLTVNPALEIEKAANEKTEAAPAEDSQPAPQSGGKLCPHCGKPLPADY